jgi:hypothetical protein
MSYIQQIAPFLWQVPLHTHKSSSPVRIAVQISCVHNLIPYLFNIYLNIIFPFVGKFAKWYLPAKFSTKLSKLTVSKGND